MPTDAELKRHRMSPVQMVRSAKLVTIQRGAPSLAMADFISNSAIFSPMRPSPVLAAADQSRLGVRKMAEFGIKSAMLD